jgi:phosphoglycolate phosphatase
MHPFMVSYGFEDYDRLTEKFEIPHELISRTSGDLCQRVRHALDLANRRTGAVSTRTRTTAR